MDIIVTALLTGQKTAIFNGIEVRLKPLKVDTQKNKEREANKIAAEIIKLIS